MKNMVKYPEMNAPILKLLHYGRFLPGVLLKGLRQTKQFGGDLKNSNERVGEGSVMVSKITAGIAAMIVIIAIVYACFWLAKHGSYYFWYEELVKTTVKEMVQPGVLR